MLRPSRELVTSSETLCTSMSPRAAVCGRKCVWWLASQLIWRYPLSRCAKFSQSSLYCKTLIRRKSRGNAFCLSNHRRGAASLASARCRWSRSQTTRRNSSPYDRPRPTTGATNLQNRRRVSMTMLDNRCANCGGKFGLVCHHHWRLRFCRKACRDNFLAKTAKDHARMRRWFGFSARGMS